MGPRTGMEGTHDPQELGRTDQADAGSFNQAIETAIDLVSNQS